MKTGRPDIPEPNGGEKDWMGGSSSGSEYLEEGPVPLAEVIAKMRFQEATSSNISEAETDHIKTTEKTAITDQALPVSSTVPEASASYTPSV